MKPRLISATEFSDPPAAYRPRPLFTLNDEYEPGRGEARLTAMLESLRRVGYGGAFFHPRPGLITEYLSPRWFEVIRHGIAECRRLGLVPALYDENSYPSGFAGGHVPARAPETMVRYVVPRFGQLPEPPPDGAIALYRMEDGRPAGRVSREALPDGAAWCAFVLDTMAPTPWHGEFAYTSMVDPRTTELFIETTYQRYRDELGEEGWKACDAIFTDEPHLPADLHAPWGRGLQFSRLIQGEFARRRGYPIEDVLADLYFDSPTAAATRFDFYETLHALWMENFADPLHAWCRKQGIPLTGHYLEHDWPCPYTTPGHVHLLTRMDWPGTDLLECFVLEGHDFGDPQNFVPAQAGVEPLALHYLRQVLSVANQFGKERVMNESWGAGGHDSTPHDWLRIGRFLAVHGVNLFVPHYAMTTLRGGRKRDHPQFFSEQSPWFEALKPLNDELGRLAWVAARGKMRQRVLVLDVLTTGYCLAAKGDCLEGSMANLPECVERGQRRFATLREEAVGFSQRLSDAQVDFDIGDEYVLAESSALDGKQWRVGEQTYELIVLPPGMGNLRAETLRLLEEFARAGGTIAGVRPAQAWLDGRPSDWPARLAARWAASPEALAQAVAEQIPPRLRFSSVPSPGMAHQRRESAEGIYYLIVNSSPRPWSGTVTMAEGGGISLLDPRTGEAAPFGGALSLGATEAVVLLVGAGVAPEAAALPSAVEAVADGGEPVAFLGAERLEPNVVALDFCALQIGHEQFPPQLVYEANRIYWQRHGLGPVGWGALVQFRDQMLAANRRMAPDSGGTARYAVAIAPGIDLGSIDLAFECPEQWRGAVNGRPLNESSFAPWLDHRIGRVAVGAFLQAGENVVTLSACPFDVRQEIDQIYLLGDFGVQAEEAGFSLAPARPLALGSWKEQGLPFYDRRVSYRFRRPAGAGRLRLGKDDWHGSVVELAVGARRAQSYGPAVEFAFASTDPGEFTLTVTGLPCNLLGPWHQPGLLPKRAWACDWHGETVPNAPQPGRAYRQLDLGIFRAPTWAAAKG